MFYANIKAMRQSKLFSKTLKESPKDAESVNAKLLERGGFIYKNSAGIYSYLPLGYRVLQKIAGIVREEMNAIGGQEIIMPILIERKYYEKTGRDKVDIVFETKGSNHKTGEFIIGWSHEEVLTEIASKYISSYKDLPFAGYQIQTKARNEPRAKSGILRGREFLMKDLYSFHQNEKDLFVYYEKVKEAYHKIFARCGLTALYTVAAGGVFTSSNTNEFQVISPIGEDTIFVCRVCEYAENIEISKLKDGEQCPKCGGNISEKKSIEVGNIFPLGTKYSEAFNLKFTDENGEKRLVVMGSYGVGISRVMGTVVEIHHDEKGIIWPESIAPFSVHMISIGETVQPEAEKIYEALQNKKVEVFYDDRDKAAGEKFADADLLGIPMRVVISEKTVAERGVEIKKRGEEKTKIISIENFIDSY